jgi:hypothetical protein
MKRRIHALRITYEIKDNVRVPLISFKERDGFSDWIGHWQTKAPMPVFKDAANVLRELSTRRLGQTDYVRIDTKPVKGLVDAAVKQLKAGSEKVKDQGQASAAGRGSGTAEEAERWWENFLTAVDERWKGVPDNVLTLKNPAPFTAVNFVPTALTSTTTTPQIGRDILSVSAFLLFTYPT